VPRRTYERLVAAGITDESADEIRQEWRGELLAEVLPDLSPEWLDRLDHPVAIRDNGPPEPVAVWGRAEAPFAVEQLSELEPDTFLGLLATWQPAQPPATDSP